MGNWADLPPELLDVIAQGFDVPSDTRLFRSVCEWWRWAVPLPRSIHLDITPIKFLAGSHSDSDSHWELNQCHVRLAKHTFFRLSHPSDASSGWLIKIEEHKPGAFHLFNPFSRVKASPLASNSKLDLRDLNIQELGHEYVLYSTCHVDDHDHDHLSCDMKQEKVAFKLISSCYDTHDYAILSTHNTGKLLLYHSQNGNEGAGGEWEFLDDFNLGYDERSIFVNDWSLHYVDVAEYQSTFYAVTNSGRTVAIHLSSSGVTVTLLTKSIIGGDRKCLVKSKDDLLMVDLYTCPTPGAVKVHAVEIYKLDKEEQRWVLVEGLEDRALFLSNHSCFSAEAFPGCQGNSIYFQLKNLDLDKDGMEHQNQSRKQGSVGDNDQLGAWKHDGIDVFDYGKGTVGSLPEYLQDSQLFSWPPPQWDTLST